MSKKAKYRDAFAQLDAIYARLPTMHCKGLCGHQVCGAVPMTGLEADRLRQTAHQAPRTAPRLCVYLSEAGKCRVYAARPFICRVFGLLKRLSCMHGCVPERWLSDYEFVALGAAIEQVGGALVTTAPEGLVEDARSFSALAAHADPAHMPPELADHYATLTQGLRALYGGRVIAVTPTPAGEQPRWIDVDKDGGLA